MTFDVAVCERLRAAFADVFLNHPEVKALATSICWNGNLNDARIMHGIWLGGDGGPVQTAEGVIGSAFQTLKMLDEQVGRAVDLVSYFRDQLRAVGPEIVAKNEELKRLEEEIEDRRATLKVLAGGAV